MQHYDNAHRGPVDYAASAPQVARIAVDRLLAVGGRNAVWEVSRTGPPSAAHLWAAGAQPPVRMALKVPLRVARAQASRHSLKQEFEAMLSLGHPHLVRTWGLAQTSQGPGLLAELHAGGSLGAVLARAGRISVGQTVTALTPIAQACAHLHQFGAAHGDVTAANILLTPEGRPALGDLGDAQLLGMPAREASWMGDVAGLAATAWQCLSGQRPEGRAVRMPLKSLRPDLSADLIQLLEDSLEPSQGVTAGEFAGELFAQAQPVPLDMLATADEHVLSEMPTVLPGAAATRSRRPWWRRLWGPSRIAGPHRSSAAQSQSPSWASKLPSSRRAFRV